jgi:hypothetical protein
MYLKHLLQMSLTTRMVLPRLQLCKNFVAGFLIGSVFTALLRLPKHLSSIEKARDCVLTPGHYSESTAMMPLSYYSDSTTITPLSHTDPHEYLPGHKTDALTYFHKYATKFSQLSPPSDFTSLPVWDTWSPYFEAYNNHFYRYRGKEVVFMEVGVQSGGKIPLLRDYFGTGFTYIGIDINPSVEMFASESWIHIEIGDSGDRDFWHKITKKYPKVDIFLDDGGHTMQQQRLAMEIMLPHVAQTGVYICEDLATSWAARWEGVPMGESSNEAFRKHTMVGLIQMSLEWFHAGWMSGGAVTYQLDEPRLTEVKEWKETPWWKVIPTSVKHIHYYNSLVVYEKGIVEDPLRIMSGSSLIPLTDSGKHEKVAWGPILNRIWNTTV